DDEFTSYKSVVLKLADLMCSLEEQSGFLSRDFTKSGTGKIHGLCETLMEDLNNYCECMIPIGEVDDLNTLNIKLFPLYPPPPPVKAWQVPLFIVRYETFIDENWDLTMQRIVPFINGVYSARMISVLANVDFSLTCRAIRHLVYYGCVFLLDIFSFSAIYAPTAQFNQTIVADEDMQRECAAYVNTKFAPTVDVPSVNVVPTTSSAATAPTPDSPTSVERGRGGGDLSGQGAKETLEENASAYENIWPEIVPNGPNHHGQTKKKEYIDGVGIVQLYADLHQGQTVRQWYMLHVRELANIDIRRFITFGVIKGFLYRVRKYAISTNDVFRNSSSAPFQSQVEQHDQCYRNSRATSTATNLDAQASSKLRRMLGEEKSDNTNWHDDTHDEGFSVPDDDDDWIDDRTLSKYLDGQHHFDQICTELEMTDSELMSRLKMYPFPVHIIHR
ncbi:hypothetical protein KEM56_003597, partial [Ascosphaera pollenicola]